MVRIEGLPSRYTVVSLLGEGGFGKVFRVRDSHREETLALKVISRDSAAVRASLMKEFKILAGLQHPNLIRVHDFGHLSPRLFYFTMEYLEGNDLRTFFSARQHLVSLPSILEQLLDALAYLHRNGVIHGDIKPENIFILKRNGSFIAKLLDFGLTSSGRVSKQITVSGTPRFLAPEILTAGARKGPATDLYALGTSLAEAILGSKVSAPTEVTEQTVKRQGSAMSARLAELGIKNSTILSSFIVDLSMPDPDQRPQSAESALRYLTTISAMPDRIDLAALETIFVDREEELATIRAFLNLRSKGKKILVMSGPRGSGKKSLLRKAVQTQQLKRHAIIDLGSTSYEHFSIEEISRAIASQLGSSDRALLMGKVASVKKSARDLRAARSNENIARRSLILFDHLIEGLRAISLHTPVLLLFPDIERFHMDYCRFADHIVNVLESTDPNISLLLTASTDVALAEDVSRLLAKLYSREYTEHLEVQGFGDRATRSYLREVFGADLLSDREITAIKESTRGIPLLLAILIRQLYAENVFKAQDGRWVFDRASFARRRATREIDEAFAVEFDTLPDSQQALLEMLACIDRGIPKAQLLELWNSMAENHIESIDFLFARGILRTSPPDIIDFAHPLYRSVALAKASPARTALFNTAIAEFLAKWDSSDSLRIARHYIAAENVDMSLRFGLEAADKLYSEYMPYDCLGLLLDIKELIARKGIASQLQAVLERLAPIEHQTGLLSDSLSSYTDLIKREPTPEVRARHMIQRAILQNALGNAHDGFRSLKQAMSYCERNKLRSLQGEIYFHLGENSLNRAIYYLSKAANLFKGMDNDRHLLSLAILCYRHKIAGNMKEAQSIEHRIIGSIDSAGDHARKGIYQYLASVHLHSAEYKIHRSFLEKKMRIERHQDDSLGLIDSLMRLGGSYYVEGNYASLIDTLKEVHSLATRYNQKVTAVNAQFNLVLAYRVIGELGRALEYLALAERSLREKAISQISSVAFIKAPQLYALLGEATEGEFTKSNRNLHLASERANNRMSLGHYNMCYSTYHQINGRYRRSLGFAEKAIALFTRAEDRDDIVLALVQKAIVQASLDHVTEAAKVVARATKIYEEIHCEYLKPFLMLGRGMIARLAGEGDARALLAEGLRASRKMGTREITWQLQRELALYHRDRGEAGRAMEYYQDAIDTLKQITETLDDEKLRVSYLQVPVRNRVFDEIRELRSEIRRSS